MTDLKGSDYVLAGDIGGTKTSLGIFKRGKRRPAFKYSRTYPSMEFKGLEDIIELFLETYSLSVTKACFGVAGPVQNGKCKTTNLPWQVHENRIERRFGFKRVRLLNDLSAMALSIPCLMKNELFTINAVKVPKGQNIGLIAPGTGLGESLLFYRKGEYFPIPSEGGHTDFSPRNEIEMKLLRYLRRQYGHVSMERVLSGPGIFSIYKFLRSTGSYKEPKWLTNKIRGMDPARLITETALNKGQKLCMKTLDFFVSILGAAAGNLALTGMTTGGVYLGGGIPQKILPKFKERTFMDSFTDKGRFKSLMKRIPVHVVLNDRAPLLGAAIGAFSE
jgi:glucokinase